MIKDLERVTCRILNSSYTFKFLAGNRKNLIYTAESSA